jgi:guanylate kinase
LFAVREAAEAELRSKASGRHQPRLFILTAASGTGKDAVLAKLQERGVDVYVVVTCTTRERRHYEVNGEHYQFVSEEEFLGMRSQGDLLEDIEYAGHYYGVPAQPARDAVARGQDVILKIEVRGASIVKLQVPGTVMIFLAPPSVEELARRLTQAQRERGVTNEKDLADRLAHAQRELACIPGYDYLVVNHTGRIDQAVDEIEAIIRAERCRVSVPPVRV